MGIVGAGSNNARLAGMLRSLGTYYEGESEHCFAVRLSLGLLHLGKGLVGISPYYSGGFLCSGSGLAGIIIIAVSMLNVEEFLIWSHHYLL